MTKHSTSRIFLAGAGLMLAHQVAGKAVRDGLFLSRFAAADLPKIVVLAAIVSLLLGVAFVRILSRRGPLHLVPAAIATSAVLHVLEYGMLKVAHDGVHAPAVVLVYLHIVGFTAILLSGFWSIVNEVLDAREARRHIGKIAAAGTIGGVLGGVLAERGAALLGTDALLLVLGALHLLAAVFLWCLRADSLVAKEPAAEGPVWKAAQDAFRQSPFLMNLAVLILMGTISTTLLDYLFKSGAAAQYGKGSGLTRYFALFYTVNQILSFAVQSCVTPATLQRFGLGRMMQWHPAAVAVGASASLFFPQSVTAPVLRSLQLVLRSSFLRSGYELFFTPVPSREKRAVKLFIDVGCDRVGDAIGAGALQMLLLLGPQRAVAPILVIIILFAIIDTWITSRMEGAYAKVVEHGLVSRSAAMHAENPLDTATFTALFRTGNFTTTLRPHVVEEATLNRVADLRSGSPERIKAVLKPGQAFDPALAAPAIRLLARAEVFEWARAFLLVHGHRVIGQLVDTLLDSEEELAVRRRIPAILAYTSSQRAVDGLTAALEDPCFTIRFNTARALEFLHRVSPGLRLNTDALRSAVALELSVPHQAQSPKSLEYVFSLLAMQLPPKSVKAAYRALHGGDRQLRSLALEYLESHLSDDLAAPLRSLSHRAG